ncbi:Spermidine hydroxycinnamoyl transferase, partial [Thalictrum thalictroides]
MVSIKCSYTVKPNQETPAIKLWLPEIDQYPPTTHAPTVYFYRPVVANGSVISPLETLKSSLSCALVHYFPLAGRLQWISGGRLELQCNGMGAEVIEAESENNIGDYGDFRPTTEIRKLAPSVDYSKDISDWPLLLVQLTKLKCGGICIGIAVSHIVVDGKGALGFISTWANIARGHQDKLAVEPFHDRTVFYKGDPTAKPRFDHVEFKAQPTLIGGNEMEERQKETTVTMLKLTQNQVEKLKQIANNEGRTPEDLRRAYTRYEAIAGHIWICASKARRLQTEQLTNVRIAVDCRNRVQPSLPPGYYGNAIMVTAATAKVGELLSVSPLGLDYACGKIRKAQEMISHDYLKSAMDFLASQPDMTPFRTGFHTLG